jgi:hypothetical protein
MKYNTPKVACLLGLMSIMGCVNMAEWNRESERALRANLSLCIAHKMTQSELLMQVGPPTTKEAVEDGQIWIYDLADVGDTQTTGQIGPFGTFSATSTTPVDRTRIIIRFDKNGTMSSYSTFGPARQQFRFLRPPVR